MSVHFQVSLDALQHESGSLHVGQRHMRDMRLRAENRLSGSRESARALLRLRTEREERERRALPEREERERRALPERWLGSAQRESAIGLILNVTYS